MRRAGKGIKPQNGMARVPEWRNQDWPKPSFTECNASATLSAMLFIDNVVRFPQSPSLALLASSHKNLAQCVFELLTPNRLCLELKHPQIWNQNCTVFRLVQVRFR